MIHKPNPQPAPARSAIPRRVFLGALAAGAMASVAPQAVAANAAGQIDDDRRKARYRESEEVKTFYRVNRYPGQGG